MKATRSRKRATRKPAKAARKAAGKRMKAASKKTAPKKAASRPAKKSAAAKKPVVKPMKLTAATYQKSTATARDTGKSTAQRIAALEALSPAICDDATRVQSVFDILRDTNEAAAVRRAALRVLQAASFSVIKFAPYRADYIATLRAIASDPDKELRQRVLGLLSRETDGYAQKLLLDGLKDPKAALLPPEKALQLLSYDVHADAYGAARQIVDNPPNTAARREALRLLAADSSAAPVFEKILRDKSEASEMRQLSASALQSIAPKALQSYARDIVLDDKEDDEVRATSLTALTDLRSADAGDVDDDLYKRVSGLKKASSAAVKKSAQRFMAKYKR